MWKNSIEQNKQQSPKTLLTSLLNVQENHDIVTIDVELEGIVGKHIVVTKAPLNALQSKGRMHREQAIFVEFNGDGRQAGARASGQALGQSHGLFDLAVRQSAYVIRAKVTEINDTREREKQAYPYNAA